MRENHQKNEARKLKTFYLLLILVFSSFGAAAEIYKWVDENGKIHFGDRRPTNQVSDQVKLKINTYESVSYDMSTFDVGEKVIMYSASWCGFCKKARQYFEKNDIDYVEYDIEKNKSAKRAYDKLNATGVPVILVGKERMNGFSVAGFRRIYEQ
ncbi:glutaredoxin domain-containing protein [Marinobacter salexigens]|uniref:DUF4124 domain-containing protein n=1 Tax=Marinobacter salexigens TaxID=1925763 RepID=A0ABS6A5Y9_9GAMM|nr:glutaredoxin domain-containing protein [Marinobacter salexigens]MBU2873597.1 DUF4124 domain-containing protein [Marinobacter salexigens]